VPAGLTFEPYAEEVSADDDLPVLETRDRMGLRRRRDVRAPIVRYFLVELAGGREERRDGDGLSAVPELVVLCVAWGAILASSISLTSTELSWCSSLLGSA
ncbi:MAG: hypothetical protein ACRDJ3_06285, partial [Solirubrobacteraceae bacterium]